MENVKEWRDVINKKHGKSLWGLKYDHEDTGFAGLFSIPPLQTEVSFR